MIDKMTSMNNLLTDQELEELTRAKRPNKQAQILDVNGIYYIRRADGSIITTWNHVDNPKGRVACNDNGVNLGAIV